MRLTWGLGERLSALAILSIIVATSLGCESGEGLEIVNQSDSPVVIDYGPTRREGIEPGLYQTRLEPGESMGLFVALGSGIAFTVVRLDGRSAEEVGFNWDELVAMEFRFVVE